MMHNSHAMVSMRNLLGRIYRSRQSQNARLGLTSTLIWPLTTPAPHVARRRGSVFLGVVADWPRPAHQNSNTRMVLSARCCRISPDSSCKPPLHRAELGKTFVRPTNPPRVNQCVTLRGPSRPVSKPPDLFAFGEAEVDLPADNSSKMLNPHFSWRRTRPSSSISSSPSSARS